MTHTHDTVAGEEVAETTPETTPETRFVSVYAVSRCYGGPEEGGWWYDWWELVESSRVLPGHNVDEYKAFYAEEYPTPRISRFSANGSFDMVIVEEHDQGGHQSTERPYYC